MSFCRVNRLGPLKNQKKNSFVKPKFQPNFSPFQVPSPADRGPLVKRFEDDPSNFEPPP